MIDPIITRAIGATLACALYACSFFLPVEAADHIREAAMLLLGAVSFKRPGDNNAVSP